MLLQLGFYCLLLRNTFKSEEVLLYRIRNKVNIAKLPLSELLCDLEIIESEFFPQL
jgi:hypothetical protein